MTTYIADTGVFVRCGGPDNKKYQRLRRTVQQAGISLLVPRRVYEELGGDPDDEAYPSSNSHWQEGVEEDGSTSLMNSITPILESHV